MASTEVKLERPTPSITDLPDELLVKIFTSIPDNDPTKIRLERVSKRFFRCLRESWKFSYKLDLGAYNTLEGATAFLRRIPQITHLRLFKAQEYEPKHVQALYLHASQLKISKLEYDSGDIDMCHANAQLMIWCLTSFGTHLETLDYICCVGNQNGYCDSLYALKQLLPSCKNLKHLRLSQMAYDTEEWLLEALSGLKLTSLTLNEVHFHLNGNWAQLLNSNASVESVDLVLPNLGENDTEHFIEFCQTLNPSAARVMRKLKVALFNWDSMMFVSRIYDFLPNMRDLSIEFDGRLPFEQEKKRDDKNDAENLIRVIQEFISQGRKKDCAICFELRVRKTRHREFHFGMEFLWLLLSDFNGNCKRNIDFCNWKKTIEKENVKIHLNTTTIDWFTTKREFEAKRINNGQY